MRVKNWMLRVSVGFLALVALFSIGFLLASLAIPLFSYLIGIVDPLAASFITFLIRFGIKNIMIVLVSVGVIWLSWFVGGGLLSKPK